MTLRIFFRTLPYVFMRAVVFLLFALAMIAFLALVVGVGAAVQAVLASEDATGVYAVTALVAIGGLIALVSLGQRYVLYLVKIGHVAVITELVTKGDLPPGTNQFSYGKDKVLRHFGSASALFAVDQLVAAAVRQIMGWLTSLAGCLREVPGVGLIVAIVRSILTIATNYIDEAVMSYILMREGENVWQAAADGVVLYAQSWKKLLATATILALTVGLVWLAGFALLTLGFGAAIALLTGQSLALGEQAPYALGAIPALFLANVFRWLLIDPLATVAMVVSYDKAVQGQVPSYDLRAQLTGVSRKFRTMTERAAQPAPYPTGS